jgi:hypothetical protein
MVALTELSPKYEHATNYRYDNYQNPTTLLYLSLVGLPPQGLQWTTDRDFAADLLAKRFARINAISHAPARPLFSDIAGFIELGDQLACRPLGNAWLPSGVQRVMRGLLARIPRATACLRKEYPLCHDADLLLLIRLRFSLICLQQ